MPYLMRGRNESSVRFEYDVAVERAELFIGAWSQHHPDRPIDLLHLACWALRVTLDRYPAMNRYVACGRLYQRRGIWFTVKSPQSPAAISWWKRRFDCDDGFGSMVEGIGREVTQCRARRDRGQRVGMDACGVPLLSRGVSCALTLQTAQDL
jgi:hypothetical protein